MDFALTEVSRLSANVSEAKAILAQLDSLANKTDDSESREKRIDGHRILSVLETKLGHARSKLAWEQKRAHK